MNYLFYMGATEVDIKYRETAEQFEILCRSNFDDDAERKIEKMKRLLSVEKHEEMEEYYWALAGDCDVANELPLVGMMVDESRVRHEGSMIEIALYRKKDYSSGSDFI